MDFEGDQQAHLDIMNAKITEAWEKLNSIWTKMGYDEDGLLRRRKTVTVHVAELLDDMCQEADARLEEQQNKLKVLLEEIVQLSKDLSIDQEQVPELQSASGKPLLEMHNIFLEVADGLRKRKAVRMEKYNIINEQVIGISEELDETPMQIEFEGIPADSQVVKLEHHLGQLHQEKRKRLDQFYRSKKEINELFGLLERNAQDDLELLMTDSNDEIDANNVISSSGIKAFSRRTLKALQDLERNCIHQLEANKAQGDTLWQKIRELWSRLSADDEMMLVFTQVHRPISKGTWEDIYKPSVLKGLQKELERLEEEKKMNMCLFITQCREELCDLWMNKCFMTSVQDRFMEENYMGITNFVITDFNDEVYTEELLEKHEKEVEFWKGFIERNRKIIEGVARRGEMFSQYKILDQKSDDPSRLANRGGALLKEEKERKRLEKTIPKLDNELKQLCDQFEEQADAGYGMTKFLVYGRTIHEMIEQDWEQFHEEKRLRKEAKQKKPAEAAGGNKTMMTTQLGNPGGRKRPATPSSAQRGTVTPSKRNKTTTVTPGKTIQSPFLHPSSAAAPSNSTKRPLTKVPRLQKKTNTDGNQSMNNNWYFRPNTSATQAASRKILRKSIDKVRNVNVSSFMSSSSSSGSSAYKSHLISSSQPNLQMKAGSSEQLDLSKVIRGHGPPVDALKERTPKTKKGNKENFAQPHSAKTPNRTGVFTRQASAGKIVLPSKLATKEQAPHSSNTKISKDSMLSPVASYSEFTDHLLCQSTLNSSAVVPIVKAGAIGSGANPTTPTKTGMSFAPAKRPLTDNCF